MRRNNSSSTIGLVALSVVGAFFAYRNRYAIQRFLESYGVDTPLDTSSAGSAISSAGAKISGQLDNSLSQAV